MELMESDIPTVMVETATATPLPSVIISLAVNAKIEYQDALCELIDNAFDADAKLVELDFKSGSFRISDDGRGTTNLASFARLGEHVAQGPSTISGCYGVGGKEAVLYIGGFNKSTNTLCNVRYVSVQNGIQRTLTIDWTKQAAASTWNLPPTEQRKALIGHDGTAIEIQSPHLREWKGGWENLAERLGRIYDIALRKGRRIRLKTPKQTLEVKPFNAPALEDVIEGIVECNGRTAIVRAGIIKKGQKDSGGQPLTYIHGYRAIMFTDDGCGFNGQHNIYGTVTLDDSWARAKNKNAIMDGAEELYEAVQNLLSPLSPKVESLGIEMSYAAARDVINERFKALGGDRSITVSGHKNKPSGNKLSENKSGKKRGNNGNEGNGFAHPDGLSYEKIFGGKRTFQIAFAELSEEVECDVSSRGICTANIRYPHVKKAIDDIGKKKSSTFWQIVAAALAAHIAKNGLSANQLKLPNLNDGERIETTKLKIYLALSEGNQ